MQNPSPIAAAAAAASVIDRALSIAILIWLAPAVAAAEASAPAGETIVVLGAAETPTLQLTRIEVDRSSPQSLLTSQAIEKIATPFADFGTLANLLPSFVSSAPNGNGFDAAKNVSLRGFPDGQFNVLIDGIPIADPDGFAHHSTSIFPASSIEQLRIDRSPGSGTDLGYATIGGSLNIASLALPGSAGARVYGSYGSFATSLIGARYGTARPTEGGQTGFLVNVQHMQTDGAMTLADGRRDDILLKSESRIGAARLTLLYTYDDYHFKNPPSVSTAQIDQFGPRFGFTDVPGTPTYNGYAQTDRSADFGYARLQAGLGADLSLSETFYTYAYDNLGYSLKGDSTASPVGNGFGIPAGDIGGRSSHNKYRAFGNILQIEHVGSAGVLRVGLWIDHSRQTNRRDALDLTTGLAYNINRNAASPVLFDYVATLDTVQPYAEYEWRPDARWTVRPGLRVQSVRRGFDAGVVPNSLPGTNGKVERKVDSTLPSLDVNYAFTPQTHGYAQWAKGALVPNQSFFYTGNPAAGNQAQPQTATALQSGIKHASGGLNFAVDVYVIDLKNYISTVTQGGNTSYVNNGRVRYRGIEFEADAVLGAGFTAVANASVLRAEFRTSGVTSPAQMAGDSIPLVPRHVGLAGLLFEEGAWSGSLLAKFVGSQYQGRNGSSDGPNYRVAGYSYLNLGISRSLDDWLGGRRSRLALQVNNLEDRNPVTDTSGPSAAGPLLVNVLARRSVTLSLSSDF